MKKFTYAQILSAFTSHLKKNWRAKDVLDALSHAPFYKTTIKLTTSVSVKTESTHEWMALDIPIHILINDADIKKSVIAEVVTQIHNHVALSYYRDDPYQLIFKDLNIQQVKAYSNSGCEQAIFHEEQECGFSWLVISPEDLTAPISYEKHYRYDKNMQQRTITKREETNCVTSRHFKEK